MTGTVSAASAAGASHELDRGQSRDARIRATPDVGVAVGDRVRWADERRAHERANGERDGEESYPDHEVVQCSNAPLGGGTVLKAYRHVAAAERPRSRSAAPARDPQCDVEIDSRLPG